MDAHLGLYLNSQAKGSWAPNNLFKAGKAGKVIHPLKPSLLTKTQFTYVKNGFKPAAGVWSRAALTSLLGFEMRQRPREL